MKTVLYIFLLISSLTVYAKEWSGSTFKVLDLDYLDIYGKTNVNTFKFHLNKSLEPDSAGIDADTIHSTRLNIPVKRLHTDNKSMYFDFLTLLRESEYPEISIDIDDTFIQNENFNARPISPVISITIAGVTNRYRIKCHLKNFADDVFLEGAVQLKLTDFHLTPPTKMLGLVKVKDEINIKFGILIAEESDMR